MKPAFRFSTKYSRDSFFFSIFLLFLAIFVVSFCFAKDVNVPKAARLQKMLGKMQSEMISEEKIPADASVMDKTDGENAETAPSSENSENAESLESVLQKMRMLITERQITDNLEELRRLQGRLAELNRKVSPSVVGILIGKARGSGVIVSKDGLILTAGHVSAAPGREAKIFLADGRTVKGKTLGGVNPVDAGMIRIMEPGEYPYAEVDKEDSARQGDWCVTLGHPLGYRPERPPVLRLGEILLDEENLLQSDCVMVSGDSGGPLFSMDGKVIGINSRISEQTTQNFHVPIRIFLRYWDEMLAGELSRHTMISPRQMRFISFLKVCGGVIPSIARIRQNGEDVALGTVVRADGWIVTKADNIRPSAKITCEVLRNTDAGMESLEAKIVAVDETLDLMLLKVAADGLTVPRFEEGETPGVGQWVIVPTVDGKMLHGLGVVSVPPAAVAKERGIVGVILEDRDEKTYVRAALANFPAARQGVSAGDRILGVAGVRVNSSQECVAEFRKYKIGDKFFVELEKDGEIRSVEMELAPDSDQPVNALGVGLSRRRGDYPEVIQHDAVVAPESCGGPAVNLEGHVIGINIARAGRTETFTLPIRFVEDFVGKAVR